MTADRKPKLTVPDLAKKKAAGERLSMVAVADFTSATWAWRAGIDIVGIGDSMGMTMYGDENTLEMIVDQMLEHTKAAWRARHVLHHGHAVRVVRHRGDRRRQLRADHEGVGDLLGDNYPRNMWWVAGRADEITTTPIARWLLEMPVVLYRTEDGTPVALDDRCPHRWAPLSEGRVDGDQIVCPYHGMRFGTDGSCTLVPTQTKVPAGAAVARYPLRESGEFVWIWSGSCGRAPSVSRRRLGGELSDRVATARKLRAPRFRATSVQQAKDKTRSDGDQFSVVENRAAT